MKYPKWLGILGPREEIRRKAAGLSPREDGWYKSVNGKTRFICGKIPLSDAIKAAPNKIAIISAKDSGRAVRTVPANATTIEQLAEIYLAWLLERVNTGHPKKLARRTYDDNVAVLDRFVELAGPNRFSEMIGAEDFGNYAKTYLAGKAATTRRREIIYIEAFANWAAPGARKSGHLKEPWHFGPNFSKPSQEEIDNQAADNDKAYSNEEMATAFRAVSRSELLTAAAHLGFGSAFIPKDIGTLRDEHVDLDKALIVFARGKTGVGRMCPLIPKTVDALRRWLEKRANLKCDPSAEGLFFRTRQGFPLARSIILEGAESESATDHNALIRIWSRAVHLPFSGLRSTFATLADDWIDERAIDIVMGHKVGRASKHIRRKSYAKRFDPMRPRRLVEHVWTLAFGPTALSDEPLFPDQVPSEQTSESIATDQVHQSE